MNTDHFLWNKVIHSPYYLTSYLYDTMHKGQERLFFTLSN